MTLFDHSLISSSILFVFYLTLPLLIASLAAGVVSSFFQLMVRADDVILTMLFRLLIVGTAAYFFIAKMLSDLQEYCLRYWGGSDFYI